MQVRSLRQLEVTLKADAEEFSLVFNTFASGGRSFKIRKHWRTLTGCASRRDFQLISLSFERTVFLLPNKRHF